MNNFNWDEFETEEEPQKVTAPQPAEEKKVPFNWDEFETIEDEEARQNKEPDESMTSQVIRHLSQVPSGYAQAFTFPLDIANLVATGESLSELEELEERLPELREKFPFANLPEKIDRKAYMEAVQGAAEAFPTQSNLEASIEKATGFPLVPKTALQKLIKFGSGVGSFAKAPAEKFKTGLIAATTSAGAQAAGVPELPAEVIGAASTQIPNIGKAIKQSLTGEKQATALAKGMIGGQSNRSTFETAEDALKTLREPQFFATPEPIKANEKGVNLKLTPKKEGLKIKPATAKPKPETPVELSNAIGDVFSPDVFYNTTQAGQAIKKEILSTDKQVYKGVNELYKKSESLNSQLNDIHPELVDNLVNQAKEILPIPQKSSIQERKLKSIENILAALADFENGQITGYKPINNQTLIKQTEAINQIVDFDFAHGKPSGIFKPLKSAIDDSIESTAKQSGNLDAYLSWREARKGHADWSQTFDNDYIIPFRDTTNQDYSKLFRGMQNIDEMNVLKSILDTTKTGERYSKAATRQLVDSKLSKFFDNPAKADKKALDEAIRELEGVITTQQGDQIRKYFREYKEPKNFKAKALTHQYNKPEDVTSKLNSRSGIRELKQDLSKTSLGKKQFKDLSQQKVRSILQEGNIKKKFSGADLYNVINKENNYEILSEILGKETVDAALDAAEKAGKKQLTTEAISKTAKKAAALKFFHYISPLIF